ncbi:MAG: dethiobiotin synthetase [Candidatus Marinamargulisbacteria bacterium]|jgi:dethiobiotin synthetase
MNIFVAGTDTDVGKTLITGLLADFMSRQGRRVITQKWVQTGSTGFSNDVEKHLVIMGKHRSEFASFEKAVCPYHFRLPASPHLAAKQEGKKIDSQRILMAYSALAKHYEMVIAEGSGGVLVPFSENETCADVLALANCPVLLVVGNKLGCINHALLSIEALQNRGISILGTVFSQNNEDEDPQIMVDNTKIVSHLSGIKFLGSLGYSESLKDLKSHFEPIGEKVRDALRVGE